MPIRLQQRASGSPPAFTTQPALSPASVTVGNTLTLTTGTATNTTSYAVKTFTVGGVDKSGELTGTGPWSWDSTGETPGAIVYVVTATGPSGSTDSNQINGSLVAVGSETATITVTMPPAGQRHAPCPIYLDATTSGFVFRSGITGTYYDPEYHELTFRWTLRGSPNPAGTVATRLNSQLNDRNSSWGKKAEFCLDTPGTYHIDLEVRDPAGNIALASTDDVAGFESGIVIANEDDDFPTTQTICVGTDFTGAPTGSNNVATATLAQAAVDAAGDTVRTRVLFRAGETHTDVSLQSRYFNALSVVGSFGTGDKPTLIPPAGNPVDEINGGVPVFLNGIVQPDFVKVRDVYFEGQWDETKERGIVIDSAVGLSQLARDNLFTLYFNVEVDGFNKSFSDNHNQRTGNHAMCALCDLRNVVNYFWLISDADDCRFAILDTSGKRSSEALGGSGTKSMRANMHSGFRISRGGHVTFDRCDIFSFSGWPESGSDGNAHQAAIRTNTSGILDCTYKICRNVLEGGAEIIDANTADKEQPSNPWNAVFESNLLISSPKQRNSAIKLGHGGTTIRNNISSHGNFYNMSTGGHAGLVELNIENNQNGNNLEPVFIQNNTLHYEQDDTLDRDRAISLYGYSGSGPAFTQLFVEDNISHLPDLNPANADTTYAPMKVTGTFTATRLFNGHRLNFNYYEDTNPPLVTAFGGTLSIPYADFTTELMHHRTQDNSTLDPGVSTDQNYWQTLDPSDTRHTVRANNGGWYAYGELGEVSIDTSDSTNMVITNNSRTDWLAGSTLRITLDRHSKLPARAYTWNGFTIAVDQTIRIPEPDTGSPAIGGITGNPKVVLDFWGAVRPLSGGTIGAIEV